MLKGIVREWPSCHPRQGKEAVAVWPGPRVRGQVKGEGENEKGALFP